MKYNIPVWDNPFENSDNYIVVEASTKEEAPRIAYEEHGLKSIEQWVNEYLDAIKETNKE